MLVWAIIMAIGVAMIQDGLCSIAFYLGRENERWRFNHAVRLVRAGLGLVLVIFAVVGLIGG